MENPWSEVLNNGNNAALGRALGVESATVNGWKKGISHPSAKMVMTITALFPDVQANHIQEHWKNAQSAAPEPSASGDGAEGDKEVS